MWKTSLQEQIVDRHISSGPENLKIEIQCFKTFTTPPFDLWILKLRSRFKAANKNILKYPLLIFEVQSQCCEPLETHTLNPMCDIKQVFQKVCHIYFQSLIFFYSSKHTGIQFCEAAQPKQLLLPFDKNLTSVKIGWQLHQYGHTISNSFSWHLIDSSTGYIQPLRS